MSERDARDRALMRAYVTGELSTKTYAWLWLSLWRFGAAWRWN